MTADIHFSPLALTHALPFLPLAQGDIDYQVDRRSEPGLIDELLAEPTTKVVLTRGGLVAVPRGQGELVDYENVKMRLATLPGAYVSAELARYPEAVAMFLGSYVGARGESVVAVDITRVPEAGVPGVGGIAGVGGAVGGVLGTQDSGTVDGALGKNGISGGAAAGIRQPGNAKGNGGVAAAKIAGPLGVPDSAGRGADDPPVQPALLRRCAGVQAGIFDAREQRIVQLGVPDSAGQGADDAFDDSVGAPVQPLAPKPTLLQQAVTRFDWVDLRGFAPHSNAREAGQATSAITLSIWHSRQRFCPTCGAAVRPALAGWAQRCTNEADGNRVLFPRVEPAVITAIVDGHDRLLLQHNAAWKDSRLYSVSAGFVEAGENLEHACRREAMEETGIKLGEVRYLGSQPWPFPASLMMAFKAHAITTDVRVDGEETMTARWVTRDEYTAELIAGRMAAPGRATIARYMIEEWLGREL